MICRGAVFVVSDQNEEWVPLAFRNHSVEFGQALFSQVDVDATELFQVVEFEDLLDVSCHPLVMVGMLHRSDEVLQHGLGIHR